MLYVLILLLLRSFQIDVYAFDNVTDTIEESRLVGGVAITTYDWIVSIHDVSAAPTTITYVAPGVAYNANWVITTDSAINPTYNSATNIKKLGVYVALSNPSTVSGTRRRVKSYIAYGSRATILHDLVILKVCPPLTTFAPFPTAAASAATPGTAASYVTFAATKQERIGRSIGSSCQCDFYTNYNTAFHFCLDEVDASFIVSADGKAVVCISGGNFVGLNVGEQNLGGEPYLDIFQYKTWLTTNAV